MWHPIKHFLTVIKHRHMVIKHCFKVGIPFQGFTHDLSKFSPTEFMEGAKFYMGDRSPNEAARSEYGYSRAWLHHKGRNKHHFEYWTDYNIRTKQVEPVKMPIKYVKEMFCDRVAAGKVYQGKNYTENNPIDYYMRGGTRYKLHPKTADLLEEWLNMIKTHGEDYTFRHIRKVRDY